MLWEHEANTPGELERVSSHGLEEREDMEDIPNSAVILFPDALAAAKEFFASTELPKSIEWFEH
jgi:hypothetical protein